MDNTEKSRFSSPATLDQGHTKKLVDAFDDTDKNVSQTESLANSYYLLAKVFYDKADLIRAQEFFSKSLLASELTSQTAPQLFKVYGFLIRIASERLDDDLAQSYILKIKEILDFWETSVPSLGADYLFGLATYAHYRGSLEEASVLFERAQQRCKEENEPDLSAKCLYALASLCHHQGLSDKALVYLWELKQLLQIVEKSYIRGSMNMLFAQVYRELDQYEQSLNFYKRANLYFQQKKSWNQIGYIFLGYGMLFKRKGNFEKSLEAYKLAEQMIDPKVYCRLNRILQEELSDLQGNDVDIYFDRTNRRIYERSLGVINFKHRFVLLEILFLLAKSPGKYFDKEALCLGIWKDEYNPLIHDKLVYTSVSRLRKLIEPGGDKSGRKYIIRGKDGYCFNPEVKPRFHTDSKPLSEKLIANIELTDPV